MTYLMVSTFAADFVSQQVSCLFFLPRTLVDVLQCVLPPLTPWLLTSAKVVLALGIQAHNVCPVFIAFAGLSHT